MSSDGDVFATSPWRHHERSFFLPWNRRLRHLQGISVRNLSVITAPSRHRGKTITDDDFDYTVKSPSKLLAQKEARTLHQTRSFTNLKPAKNEETGSVPKRLSGELEKSQQATGTPNLGKVGRRPSLHWKSASSRPKQRKLEDVARERMLESWFSLHITAIDEPVYISEVMKRSMNPSFRYFDLGISGPQVARAGQVRLKLWAKTDKLDGFILLVDLEICLRYLQFIGKNLDNFHQPLPSNCILLHFEDGIYTSFMDSPTQGKLIVPLSQGTAKVAASKPDRTASYDALMQLANLDDCIQDALASRRKIEEQINALLSHNRAGLEILEKNRQAQETVKAIRSATSAEKRQLQALKRKRDDISTSIKLRSGAIQSGRISQSRNQAAIDDLQKTICESRAQSKETLDESRAQVRRVCDDLELIYPLEPLKSRPLHFRIRKIYLPNSVFDDTNRDEIAAALNFTSTLTRMLSLYLFTPLPYPISSNLSTLTIEDPISAAIPQRTFPLYPTNVSYKFEYAVFLLNKDIEVLMNRNGLRILDIRHTLPNLKYLLYVLTAGTGDIPVRKAGGMKASDTGHITPAMSRSGSEDSIHSAVGFNVKLPDGKAYYGSLPIQVKGKEKLVPEMTGRMLPSPSGHTHVYRNSSLRQAF